jgi:hypothetical protein
MLKKIAALGLAIFEETENHQAKDKNGTYQSGKKQ